MKTWGNAATLLSPKDRKKEKKKREREGVFFPTIPSGKGERTWRMPEERGDSK